MSVLKSGRRLQASWKSDAICTKERGLSVDTHAKQFFILSTSRPPPHDVAVLSLHRHALVFNKNHRSTHRTYARLSESCSGDLYTHFNVYCV